MGAPTDERQPGAEPAADRGTGTVRAALLTGPRSLRLVDAPAPDPRALPDGEVLLRVLAGGICGSDLPAFRGSGPVPGGSAATPGTPLHEVVGEVLASRDERLAVGERVVGWAARFDGLAQRVATPAAGLHTYDPALDPTTAVLLQPLACVLDAVRMLPEVAGRRVAVIGQGPTGLLFSHVLADRGAAHVTGVDLIDRSVVGPEFGVHEVATAGAADWALGLAPADRPEIVVEAVGHQVATLAAAVTALAPGGHVHGFGIPDDPVYPFPMQLFLRKCATMTAAHTTHRRAALAAAGEYLAAHPALATGYVTDVLPLERAQHAYERALAPAPERIKVVIDLAGG